MVKRERERERIVLHCTKKDEYILGRTRVVESAPLSCRAAIDL
jgi:hypothetical protein